MASGPDASAAPRLYLDERHSRDGTGDLGSNWNPATMQGRLVQEDAEGVGRWLKHPVPDQTMFPPEGGALETGRHGCPHLPTPRAQGQGLQPGPVSWALLAGEARGDACAELEAPRARGQGRGRGRGREQGAGQQGRTDL